MDHLLQLDISVGSKMLTIVTLLPLLGAAMIAFHKRTRESEIKAAAIFFSLVTALASLYLWFNYNSAATGLGVYQFVERHDWFKSLGIQYAMGIDGIALVLVMLTTLLTPVVMASSANSVKKKVKEYFIAMLVLEAGMIGAFCAQDLFLFYVFFEVMLVPMLILIGVWGGEGRVYAAVKFFIYTLVGSLLMFIAILYCYVQADTFSIPELSQRLPEFWKTHQTAGTLCFLAFMLSFAIKTPMFPFHTWLPDAHTEAPTGGSVILAGVMLKLGTYGMIRFGIGFFPQQAVDFAPYLVTLGVIGIIYGALMALAQHDLKKLVAYSSVSHLGFVVLGLFAFQHEAAQGGVVQMINHGISTPLLFLCVGVMYDRRHTREIEDYGGLAKVMPKFATVFLIATLASIGLPGLNGFVGELLILVGSFGSLAPNQVPGMGSGFAWTWMNTMVVLAGTGIILGAVYMLWAYQRVVFGKVLRSENKNLKDLTKPEMTFLLPVVIACFALGIWPNVVLRPIENSVKEAYLDSRTIWMEAHGLNQPAGGTTTVSTRAGADAS